MDALSVDNDIFYLTSGQSYKKYGRDDTAEELDIDVVRAITPLKSFYFIQSEKTDIPLSPPKKRNIIFGVKSCDLRAKFVLDKMFMEGVCADPLYEYHLKNTLIFSSDCPKPQSSCFCSFVEGKPYVEPGKQAYDLNFSPAAGGYIVEAGSPEGEKILAQLEAFFDDVPGEMLTKRDEARQESIRMLDEINRDFAVLKNADLKKRAKENYLSGWWKEASKTCVQCTGCNNICPSCYCFYLRPGDEFQSIKTWDACHYTSYGRMAGGSNPRHKLFERFRNRYQCKFNFRRENFGVYACTGCGRCFEVCPGKIDIRKVMAGL